MPQDIAEIIREMLFLVKKNQKHAQVQQKGWRNLTVNKENL